MSTPAARLTAAASQRALAYRHPLSPTRVAQRRLALRALRLQTTPASSSAWITSTSAVIRMGRVAGPRAPVRPRQPIPLLTARSVLPPPLNRVGLPRCVRSSGQRTSVAVRIISNYMVLFLHLILHVFCYCTSLLNPMLLCPIDSSALTISADFLVATACRWCEVPAVM